MIVFGMIVFVAMQAHVVDAKQTVTVTYTKYSNDTVKTKRKTVKNNDKLVKVELYSYNQAGKLTALTAVDYGKNNKRLTVVKYKYVNNKRQKTQATYYYNTHTKSKTPLAKAYMTSYYSNGKFKKRVYHTKDAKQNEVVSVAKKQVGKNYRQGGNSPSGFDCSGLTSYVYKKGINQNIGRTSVAQSQKGVYVKLDTKNLQKGDILYWGSKSNPHHVGIYIGDGKYIHASTPSTGVQYKKLTSYKPSYAKRLIQ